MSFAHCVQTIENRLKASSLLVSDATMMLLVLLRARKATLTAGETSSAYDRFEQMLTRELLGYEAGQIDTVSKFRSCNIRTARLVDGVIVYIPNPVSEHVLYLVWGSQQVEALLAEVLDLSALESGNEDFISREIERLEARNPGFHTETGFPEIWATFDSVELLRLYIQLKALVIEICKQLQELEKQATFAAPTQSTFAHS